MPETIHDSALISIDKITFRYTTRHRFSAYLVVVTSDTKGRIAVHETPLTYPVLHRPYKDRPAVIDFGFDGFPIYSSVGDVPELTRFDVFLVRDRRAARRAGEILKKVGESDALKAAVGIAKVALTAASGGTGAVIAAVASGIAPVVGLVGDIIADAQDVVVESYSGSKIFDATTLAKEALSETLVSATGNIETAVDIMLFDSRHDLDAIEELKHVDVKIGREGGPATIAGPLARRLTALTIEL